MSVLLSLFSTEEIHDSDPDNSCLVCGDALDTEKVSLKCNHSFCYDCILHSFQGKNCHYNNSKVIRNCPYCRTVADFLPLKDGMTPLKGIHREYTSQKSKKYLTKTTNYPKCPAILKSGPNKGLSCNCKCLHNMGVCGRHKNWVNPTTT